MGRFVSAVVPFNCGPRHCGQFSASTGVVMLLARMMTLTVNLFRETPPARGFIATGILASTQHDQC
jgi:hypothetical protein